MFADLPAIYPMVTIRQMDFIRREGKNDLQVTEKLVSDYFPIKDERLQGGLDMDISQRISLKEVQVS